MNDVNDIAELRSAILTAKAELHMPSLIKVRTVIGAGSRKQGTAGVHGAPLGIISKEESVKLV